MRTRTGTRTDRVVSTVVARVLVVVDAGRRMLRLVEERQPHFGEVGHVHLDTQVDRRTGRGPDEPRRHRRTEPAGPGAGNHYEYFL